MALVTCLDAAFAYEGVIAVSGLNFSVNAGDYLCIVGENGSGKSTLLRGLLRLKRPASGKILIDPSLRQNEIGHLPQQTEARQDFPASAFEVVISGRLNKRGLKPFYTNADHLAAEENLRRTGCYMLKSRNYCELSIGQQRRVLLSRALCATEKLLILDEPVAGLDPAATLDLYDLIKEINAAMDLTIVMVSHDIAGATAYASHILHLNNAQAFFGTTAAYLASGVGDSFLKGGSGHA